MNYFLSDDGMSVELSLKDVADLVFNQRDIVKDSIKIKVCPIDLNLSVRNHDYGFDEKDLLRTLKSLQ